MQQELDALIAKQRSTGQQFNHAQIMAFASLGHDATVETPEMLWADISFEMVADSFYHAGQCIDRGE
jgi:hypothetical protein